MQIKLGNWRLRFVVIPHKQLAMSAAMFRKQVEQGGLSPINRLTWSPVRGDNLSLADPRKIFSTISSIWRTFLLSPRRSFYQPGTFVVSVD